MFTEQNAIKTVLHFKDTSYKHGLNVYHTSVISSGLFKCVKSLDRLRVIRSILSKVDRLFVFTKKFNLNKLYIDNAKGIFLSSGIILKFMKKDQQRFLKKRLRTWHSYVKALLMLQKRASIIHFSDLFGKKSILLNRMSSSKLKVRWVFIRLLYNKFNTYHKKSRRIKRWIKKKYYQLGVKEKR